MKRNHYVIFVTVLALAVMGWAAAYHYLQGKQDGERTKRQQAINAQEASAAAETGGDSEDFTGKALEHKAAPQFSLVNLDGKQVSLSDYKGKAVLVNFWATWCAPCKIEIPWFIQLHDQYAAQGFEILGLSSDLLDADTKPAKAQKKLDVRAFTASHHMNYPVMLLDDESISGPYGGVDSLPTSFFIDRKGVVVAATNGLHPRDEVEADIKKALASGGQ